MTALLEVADATLAFGGLQALGGVSLAVEEGWAGGLERSSTIAVGS